MGQRPQFSLTDLFLLTLFVALAAYLSPELLSMLGSFLAVMQQPR